MANDVIAAPWSEGTAAALNRYQKMRNVHPFTCGSGNRTDSKHLDGEGVLTATVDGWLCPYCDYKQYWAWSYMADTNWLEQAERHYQQILEWMGQK